MAAAMLGPGQANAAVFHPVWAKVLGATPIYREIKDWVLACDNTRACFAKYVSAEDGWQGEGYLSISREAGANGRLVVTLELEEGALLNPAVLRLDGRKVAGAYRWRIDHTEQTARLEGAEAIRFVRSLLGGRVLAFGPGSDAPHVSLNGLKAALLAMDEAQGRLGSQTALARPGARPASAALPALPVPVVQALPTRRKLANAAAFAASVRKAKAGLLDVRGCEPETRGQDAAYALNAKEAIVLLGCIQGAYQGTVLIFRGSINDPAAAQLFPMPLDPTVDPADVSENLIGEYTEGSWDPARATFSSSAKGRGIADCGGSSAWIFDGRDFQLAQLNSLNRCGGGPPGDWPTLYRTRTEILPVQ